MAIDLLPQICFLLVFLFTGEQKYLPIIQKNSASSSLSHQILGANPCTSTGPNNNSQILFGNCFENIYIIQMSIGFNNQSFNFQFDTGSNILWIPKIGGAITIGFNSTQSITYVDSNTPDSLTYADNSQVSGFFGSDQLKVPGTRINVTSSNILFANNFTNIQFPTGVTGLVGMGYTSIPNFLDLAYSANQINTPVFSLQLNLVNETSYLYYDGGLPSKISENTIWIQLNGEQYWQVQVIGVFVGGIQYTQNAANTAVIDSGTSYFYLNQNLFNAIKPQFFNDCQTNFLNQIVCPCSSAQNWPTFSFMFQGVQVYINSSQYTTISAVNPQICSYNFGVLSTVQNILLGDIFFRGYTISFDKPNAQVGFYGNTSIINLSGRGIFLTSQYVMCGIILLLAIYGIFVLYYLRAYKQNKSDESNLKLPLTY